MIIARIIIVELKTFFIVRQIIYSERTVPNISEIFIYAGNNNSENEHIFTCAKYRYIIKGLLLCTELYVHTYIKITFIVVNLRG